jgi:simple sugar transport system ATP-binding protein
MTIAQPTAEAPPVPAVELRGMTKHYGDLVANDQINLILWPGEIHGVLGENGAGKTTLMRVLYGLNTPDAGVVLVNGMPVTIRSPADAIAAGIGMVTQHFSLVGPMSVAENVILGRTAGFRVDLASARAQVAAAGARFSIRVDPGARVENLSLGEQQRVEILKALYRDCRVLILDEPTAVLVPQEVDALFETVRRLVADGLAVAFISHKLNEVLAITDRVTVLRRGRVEGSVLTSGTTERDLAAMMVGRPMLGVSRTASDELNAAVEPVLRITNLSALGSHGLRAVHDVSLEVRGGEILGVAGVSGNGQTELAQTIAGMRRPTSGSITVSGREIGGRTPTQVMAAGVGRIPEDRHAAVVPEMSVAYNLVLEHLDDFRTHGLLDETRVRRHAAELIERFSIKARPDDVIRTLSGGNMQKVLLARVLSREPRFLVVSQPTRGLDVGATEYVRNTLLEQRARGAAILLISEDLDELIALADRLVVLYEGRIVGEVDAYEADPDRLGLLMSGHGIRAAAAKAE